MPLDKKQLTNINNSFICSPFLKKEMNPIYNYNYNYKPINGNNGPYRAFDWLADKEKPEDQLFERAFSFCTQYLQFSNNMFTGQRQFFKEYSCQINLSGGRQWHSPTYALTYSLRHSLEPEQLDQHVILYHGVKKNQYLKQIFKSKLKPGPGQAYKGQKAKNPKMIVPEGIYGSQFLTVTMGYVDMTFPVVIQFASRPEIVTQTNNKQIFVVQEAIPIKLVFPFLNVNRQQGQ